MLLGMVEAADSGARPGVAGTTGAVGVDAPRWGEALDNLPRDYHLLDVLEARQIEHDIEQDALHDRPQPARPGLALDGLVGDRPERFFGERQANALHREQPLVLFDQSVLGLRQDPLECGFIEIIERR